MRTLRRRARSLLPRTSATPITIHSRRATRSSCPTACRRWPPTRRRIPLITLQTISLFMHSCIGRVLILILGTTFRPLLHTTCLVYTRTELLRLSWAAGALTHEYRRDQRYQSMSLAGPQLL